MKRTLSLILVVVMLLGTFTSCANIMSLFGGNDEGLAKAQENVKLLYINKAKDTNADFEVVPQVTVGQDVYTIEWSVNVSDGVKVEKTEDGKVWIRVNNKTEVDIPYVLTATIKASNGQTVTQTFNFNVPKFKELTWAEFAAADDDTPVVIKGVIGGIVETSKENDLYLQDENGGYFVYKLAVKPSEQGLKVGMTVRVSGIRDTYYGVYQVADASVEIIDETIKEIPETDITEAYKNAKDLKSADLTKYQSMYVTIKGATVLGQDASDQTYFNFSLEGKKAYVRISSSTSMLTSAGETNFKKNVADHVGYSADITGFVSIYNNNIYIIPKDENAFSNFVVAERTPAEQVAFEKDLLKDKVATTITDAGTTDLVTKPQLYTDVTISWSVSENDYVKVENNKLVVSLPDEEIKVTLTATLTQGDATDTATYEVTIAAAPTIIPQIVTSPVANTGYKYFLKQGNINQTLYFAGVMENTYYLGTTTNPAEAVDVGFEPVEGKPGEYYLYFMDGTIKTYIVAYVGTNTSTGAEVTNLKLSIHQKEANVWTFNTEHNTPVTKLTVGGTEDTYYIGSYNQFQTFSLSKISYLPSKTSFAAQFATLLDTSLVSDADKVAAEKEAINIATEYKKDGDFELPIFGSTYTQVEISWASNNAAAVVEGNILKVTQQKDAQTVTLTATITSGNVTDTKEITITIAAIPTLVPQVVDTPVAGTEYYFALYQGNRNEMLFITGNMNGYYYETTNDIDASVKVVLEAVFGKEGTFYLYTTVNGAKKYLNIVKSADGAHNNVVYGDTAVSEYVYNTTYKTVTTVLGEDTFFFGTYNTFNTFSASTIDKASGNFVAHFYELVDTSAISDADKVAQEKDALVGPNNKYTEGATVELSLAGKNFADVVISWNSNSEYAVIENGVLTITIPATETVVTITATLTCGEATETVTFEVTLVKPSSEPAADSTITIEQAIALGSSKTHNTFTEGKYYVTGVITEIKSTTYGNMYIIDENGNSIYVYGTWSADGSAKYDAMDVKPVAGDTVTLYGVVGNYNGAQIKNGWIVAHTAATPEETTPEETTSSVPEETTTTPEVKDPAADSTLTIVEAIALGESKEHNVTTEGKYYITGVVQEIKHTTYGNMYIVDENGNSIYVYGTWSADGSAKYDAMDVKPVAGDTVTLYGVVGNYNGPQIKNAWIVAHTAAAPSTPEAPEVGEGKTISFADKANRTEFTTEIQVWKQNGITVTNNKAASSTNVGDYNGRFYKGSDVIIECNGMTKIEIDCSGVDANNKDYTSAWLGATGATLENGIVTIVFETPVNSFTFTNLSAQARANSITVYVQG